MMAVGGKVPAREAPTKHKFKVQIYDFACQGLIVDERCEPYLKIDFDNFKSFRTDAGRDNLNPEWGFKAGFQYAMNYLEKLGRSRLRVQCYDRITNGLIGEASIDLQTIACGPAKFKLTLRNSMYGEEPRGLLKFTCVMKMMSSNFTVLCKDLKLTMQGCPAPARLEVSCALADAADNTTKVTEVPHSQDGLWEGPYSLSFETTLGDLLKSPGHECLRIGVFDESGVRQGEALVEFRKAFVAKPDTPVAFKVPVTYSDNIEGEEHLESYGSVGELEGLLLYQDLPVYAQMARGECVDGEVENGFWLFEGLPYPHCLSQPPPVWQDKPGEDYWTTNPQPHEEEEAKRDDIDDDHIREALKQIDLPPHWEERRERSNGVARVYFADTRSRRTTWKDPRFLPENWDQRIDPQTGKVYFTYHKTRGTTFVDPRFCPQGWDMRLSRNGEIYFAYLPAMQTTFVDPRGLPDQMEACLDDYGRVYFKNHETKTTTWEDPRDAQQEVTLTVWRQAQASGWWKDQVWREWEEIQEIAKQRSDMDHVDDEEMEVTA